MYEYMYAKKAGTSIKRACRIGGKYQSTDECLSWGWQNIDKWLEDGTHMSHNSLNEIAKIVVIQFSKIWSKKQENRTGWWNPRHFKQRIVGLYWMGGFIGMFNVSQRGSPTIPVQSKMSSCDVHYPLKSAGFKVMMAPQIWWKDWMNLQ